MFLLFFRYKYSYIMFFFIFKFVHYTLQPGATGDDKTKPTQASVRELRGLGLTPDLVICRSTKACSNVEQVKKKISTFCDVALRQVCLTKCINI